MAWKKISSKRILDHPRMQVYEDIVALPSGKQTDYVYMKTGDSAMVIALRDDGKVYLQEEYNYLPNTRLLEFPGGGIGKNEDPKVGAAREFQEEAGLAGTLTLLGTFYADNRRKTQMMYVYVATDLREVSATPEDTEDVTCQWRTPAEVNALIKDNTLNNWSALAGWAMFVNSEFYLI
jgi:8-oxo-dGTP pyrophosphatase MutT (NUDIX family)